jgi:type II secretory pathway pseudopilin PulG
MVTTRDRRGFTMIEMIAVLVLMIMIGTTTMVVSTRYAASRDRDVAEQTAQAVISAQRVYAAGPGGGEYARSMVPPAGTSLASAFPALQDGIVPVLGTILSVNSSSPSVYADVLDPSRPAEEQSGDLTGRLGVAVSSENGCVYWWAEPTAEGTTQSEVTGMAAGSVCSGWAVVEHKRTGGN